VEFEDPESIDAGPGGCRRLHALIIGARGDLRGVPGR
jgi:hypothetical protein